MNPNKQLEPAYLRYIYDGLEKGSIHPENAAELPDGLIGMYEEVFDERQPVYMRQQLLERFSIWALLKKEVSAAFVAEVLGESEDDIQDFISTYSSWFNSPESGKYQLYHERLKVFLLQKLSEGEVQVLHEKLITRLEQAIEEQKADEFEWYGLEFIVIHVSLSAIILGDGQKLLNLAYSQSHWQRQLKISKSYHWTKAGLHSVMSWASKYNKDEVIECGLQLVDLHHQEQNAAPQIVALVAEGDFDSALKRIEQFGGSDKEGLQRKFILYMLCLMELTLLDSKDKPFRKEGIKKLLKHLDEQLPIDHSLLNWNDFFPSYLMFLMACKLSEIELEFSLVYMRTYNWEKQWLPQKGPYNDLQFRVLLKSADSIINVSEKIVALRLISSEMARKGKVYKASKVLYEALKCTNSISFVEYKVEALIDISYNLAILGKLEQANDILKEALASANIITHENWKRSNLRKAEILSENGKVLEAISIMHKSLNEIRWRDWERGSATSNNCLELIKKGEIKQAFELANNISDYSNRNSALMHISTELAKQNKLEEALKNTQNIRDYKRKSEALANIVIELVEQNSLDKAIESVSDINDNEERSRALRSIFKELVEQGRFDEFVSQIEKSLESDRGINSENLQNKALVDISHGFIKNERSTEALNCASKIRDDMQYSNALMRISHELARQNKIDEALECARSIIDETAKILAFNHISSELLKQKNPLSTVVIKEALEYSQSISNEHEKNFAYGEISEFLAQEGKIDEAFECVNGIITDVEKTEAIVNISIELAKHGRIKEAISCARSISFQTGKCEALSSISAELAKQGRIEEANDTMKEAIDCVQSAVKVFFKNQALTRVSIDLTSQGKIDEALECAENISDESMKIRAISSIVTELTKLGLWNLAETIGLDKLPIKENERCWQNIAKQSIVRDGSNQSLLMYRQLINSVNRLYFLKGWAESLQINSLEREIILNGILFLDKDIESIERLLQCHALKLTFYEDHPEENTKRFNRTLNIHWAIDIKNQISQKYHD
jgi:hypothetical protein